jgi:hypothetical protein
VNDDTKRHASLARGRLAISEIFELGFDRVSDRDAIHQAIDALTRAYVVSGDALESKSAAMSLGAQFPQSGYTIQEVVAIIDESANLNGTALVARLG